MASLFKRSITEQKLSLAGDRPRAAKAVGDQRINSFGIVVRWRSCRHAGKAVSHRSVVHFGLGDQTGADVVRIVWPNGRAEFETKLIRQFWQSNVLRVLVLFYLPSTARKLVKDSVPGAQQSGLRINTLGTAELSDRGMVQDTRRPAFPHNGYYDLRITAELWETYCTISSG
jgi:hypothetical protein